MSAPIQPWTLLVVAVAGWIHRKRLGGMLNYYYREAA